MNTRLKASLEKALQDWINQARESDEWGRANFYSPDDMAVIMADASAAVFDGIVGVNAFLRKEELIK